MNANLLLHRTATLTLLVLALLLGACGTLTNNNQDPTLTAIDDQPVIRNTVTPSQVVVAFVVDDEDGDTVTVGASSSDQAVVADGQLALSCSGGACTLSFTPSADRSGEATITVSVNDRRGGTDAISFLVELVPGAFVTNLDDAGPGSLRQAVADAEPGAVIGFDEDTGTLRRQALSGTIALTEQIQIDETLTIEGPGAGVLGVSGSNLDRIFAIGSLQESTAIEVVISGLTLSDGAGHLEPDQSLVFGGAIMSGLDTDLTLRDVVVENSDGGLAGGGILSTGNLTLENTSVRGNTASSGGGIYQFGGFLDIANDSLFADNTAKDGGGLLLEDVTTAEISGGTLRGNQATGAGANAGLGGAILAIGTTSLIIDNDARFEDNFASELGGAIHIADVAALEVAGIFAGNSAGSGGALSLLSSTLAQVVSSTFDANVASGDGGAILHFNGSLNIQTSSFSGNQAISGGALLELGQAEIFGSSFSGNSAETGGAIRGIDAALDISSSTFSGNDAASGGGLHLDGGTTDLSEVVIGGTEAADANTAELGAGVYAHQVGGTFSDLELLGNVASQDGGGLFADESTLSLNGLIAGNFAARDGGGLVIVGEGPLVLGDLHITDNTADGNGGGIYSDTRQLNIEGSTLVDFNQALSGGGIYIIPNLELSQGTEGSLSVTENTPDDAFVDTP